ncbi:hypothetical protein ACFZB6_03645 [Streptomyces syringium]|uniref:hypothetical protein n=1 Tax=Streptomyces syringium TaxID=76729 RepID=UPI0036E2C262
MGSTQADEAVVAPGLRTAADFYAGKVDSLQQRHVELEAELAQVQAELARARSRHHFLSEALEELLAKGDAETGGHDTAPPEGAPGPDEEVPAPEPRVSKPRARKPRPRPGGQLMQSILQVLVTAGRPLRVKDITEALGRPTSGREGRVSLETTRSTCKRLVKNGQAAEGPVGVFTIARAEEPPVEGDA